MTDYQNKNHLPEEGKNPVSENGDEPRRKKFFVSFVVDMFAAVLILIVFFIV